MDESILGATNGIRQERIRRKPVSNEQRLSTAIRRVSVPTVVTIWAEMFTNGAWTGSTRRLTDTRRRKTPSVQSKVGVRLSEAGHGCRAASLRRDVQTALRMNR